jgi:hypothetical protein
MFPCVSDRILAAALLGSAAFLFQGCLHDESADETPPDYTIAKLHSAQGKWRFGVTDTIAVDFSEPIDTGSLRVEFEPAPGIASRFQGRDRLLIYGTETGSGASHFGIGAPFTATFAHLEDARGNGADASAEDFAPYWWADRDFLEPGFKGFDSLFASDSAWADGSPFADTLISEGNLDAKTNGHEVDYNDVKLIKLTPPDTFRALLACPKKVRMKLQLAGPFPPEAADSLLMGYNFDQASQADSTQGKGQAMVQVIADYGVHDDALGSPSSPGIYALRISVPLDNEAFYRLETTLRRKKRP